MKKNKIDLFSSRRTLTIVNFFLLAILIIFTSLNSVMMSSVYHSLGMKSMGLSSVFAANSSGETRSVAMTGDLQSDVIALVLSEGIPAVYGAELGISFDSVQSSMNTMSTFDPDYGSRRITLQGDALKRYTDVALQISCEFCCGAKSIVFADGKAACGCAHSQAMRGLLAYLLTKYPNNYTNDELLRELARWKGRYFPKQMIKKMSEQISGQKPYTPDISSLLLGVDVSNYGSGGNAPLPSSLENLPDMVGGC